MDSQRSRSLIPWAIRSHRVGALTWGFGFGVLVAIMAPAYLAAAKAIAGGLATLAAEAQPIAVSFQFLTGPVERLDTIGGYLSYKIFPDIALLFAIYAATQGAQIIRGSETKGLLDLWLAAGRTRSEIMRDRIAGFLVALLAAMTMIYVFTAVGGALAGVSLVVAALGQTVAVGLVALVALALGLVLAQFFQTASAASAVASGFLIASFFVANMNTSLGALTFLRYISPFYYYIQARTLVPDHSFDLLAMVVLLIAAGALIEVAWGLYLRRDIGGVSLARIHHTRPADYSFKPSLISRRSLWLNWITEQPLALASWGLGIVAFTSIEAAVVPTAMRLVDNSGGKLSALLRSKSILLTTDQYLSFFLSFTALLVAGFAVTQVARWASDAEQHRNDVVLTQAVSMWRLVVERAAALLVLSSGLGLSVVFGVWLGAAIGNYSVVPAGLARAFLDIVILCFAIGGVGMLAVTVLRSAAATGVTGGLLVACFFLTTVAGLLSWPSWTSRPSVFDAFGSPYFTMPGSGSLIYLLGLGFGGVLAAYVAMRRGMRIVA